MASSLELTAQHFSLTLISFFLFLLMGAFVPAMPARAANGADYGVSYDEIFPLYLETCVSSQIARRAGSPGNPYGHFSVYVKGVCIDQSAEYPRVRVCNPGEKELSDPESGVGISINGQYTVVKWVAVEGKRLAFGIGRDSPVDLSGGKVNQQALDQLLAEFKARGTFRGVRSRFPNPDHPELDGEMWAAYHAIGTDVSILWGRNLRCIRMPLVEDMLPRIVSYYNGLNDDAVKKGTNDFAPFSNNCTHAVHNVLAAIGVDSPKKTKTSFPQNLFNQAFPADEFSDWFERANGSRLGKSDANISLYNDVQGRNAFLTYDGWMRDQPGSIVVDYDQLHDGNEIFLRSRDSFRRFNYQLPSGEPGSFKKIKRDHRYTDLKSNLESYERRMEQSLKRRQHYSNDSYRWLENQRFIDSAEGLKMFDRNYYPALEAALARVRVAISKFHP